MIRFHHLGLFVRDLEFGLTELEKVIEVKDVSEVTDDFGLRVSVQFVIDSSNLRYELVAPLGENNPVDPVLKARKNILNHVAYITDDFETTFNKMRQDGCLPLAPPRNAKAFGGKKVVFMLTPLGFIYELIEG